MYKVMVIEGKNEDEEKLKQMLASYSYEIVTFNEFLYIEEVIKRENPHLIILDVCLLGEDVINYYSLKKKISNIPMIVLADKNSNVIRNSKGMGVEEVVVKPYAIQTLLGKINEVIRHIYGTYTSNHEEDIIKMKNLQLDWRHFKLSYQDKTIELSKNDVRLLKIFFSNPGILISREELVEELSDSKNTIDDSSLIKYVARLKQKLEHMGIYDVIRTIRESGYLFNTDGL